MKRTITTLIMLSAIILNSCMNQKNKENFNDKEFEFVLTGNVKNGEGKLLKLTIPSKYPNDTLISEIKNGEYLFKGKLNAVEKAGISVVNKELNKRLPTTLFLTKDTIVFDFELGEQFDELTFISDTILKSDINLYARKIDKKYWEVNGGVWVFGDSIKNDSMNKHIYPNVKFKTLELIKNELNKKEYASIKLHYLRRILESDVFSFDYLSPSEKKEINDLFIETDTTLNKTPDYKIIESYISNFASNITRTSFKDFKLIDFNGNEITLSNIISNNKITVLDFWWSGCVPCRKFNNEAKPFYSQLKEKGIEIIGINVDRQNAVWKKSSSQDQIEWINLYAGSDSNIIPEYRITYYPTKIIFDTDKNVIDFDFHTAEDLLQILKEK
ncbi:TlpA family protein disulfide reductase [Formosa algae]|uniref:Thiol-disulfide isomerase/thioredoxin n=2 Tax=Formosa algae TaxID=225843 RepID=A0A9X0YN70_9FLAO|nr:thioredoxin family protein [Formosa algae]MBP1841719.1 thiol-disulfide isomerase/thioredoxin [Formosa algae]MDQ0337207.1 thiol-disulfide isomerase/thioredoxin [Formosa algae]